MVRALGLDPSVQRYHLGFMGCYAAFPALRAAKLFCDADPEAVVMVVSAELCTLHVRTSNDPDTIVGSSLFGDGAAAAIITARELEETGPAIRLDHFETILTPVGEESMAWNIGDEGFEMVLGTYVPHIIDEHIVGALEPLLAHEPVLAARPYREIEHWGSTRAAGASWTRWRPNWTLTEEQLARPVRRCGGTGTCPAPRCCSCSSTFWSNRRAPPRRRICSMAFGPGLTVETGLFTKARPGRGGAGPSAGAAAAAAVAEPGADCP